MGLKEIIDSGLKRGMGREEIIGILLEKGYSRNEIENAFGDKESVGPAVRKEESGLNHMQKLGLLFSNPTEFFDKVKENSIKNSFLLYLLTLLVVMAISAIFAFFLGRIIGGASIFSVSSFIGLIFYPIMFGIGIVATFVYAGIVHLIIKMFHGKGNFVDTYNACAYSSIPASIISIVPFIGFLGIIYSIVLMSLGLSKYHEISKGKAAVSACIPILLFILFMVCLWFLYFKKFFQI